MLVGEMQIMFCIKPKTKVGFVLFNVYYEDGALSSNKVPSAALSSLGGDKLALAILSR